MTNVPDTQHIYTELTPRQSKLVEHMVAGNLSLAQAIAEAGYAAQSSGYAAWRSSKVQAVFQIACLDRLSQHVPIALNTQLQLATRAKSEYVRLQAAQDILDRVGMKTDTQTSLGSVEIKIDLS